MSSRMSIAQQNSCRRATCAGYERGLAPHMVQETEACPEGMGEVARLRMLEAGVVAGLRMDEGTAFYLVRSVVAPGRAFVVLEQEDICSSTSPDTAKKMIRKARNYRQSLLLKARMAS